MKKLNFIPSIFVLVILVLAMVFLIGDEIKQDVFKIYHSIVILAFLLLIWYLGFLTGNDK